MLISLQVHEGLFLRLSWRICPAPIASLRILWGEGRYEQNSFDLFGAARMRGVCLGQPAHGTLTSGSRRDQRVIPKAQVRAVRRGNQRSLNTVSNDAGFYPSLPAVAPRTYVLSAESPGMQQYEGISS